MGCLKLLLPYISEDNPVSRQLLFPSESSHSLTWSFPEIVFAIQLLYLTHETITLSSVNFYHKWKFYRSILTSQIVWKTFDCECNTRNNDNVKLSNNMHTCKNMFRWHMFQQVKDREI